MAQAERDYAAAIETARSGLLAAIDDAYNRAADAGDLDRVERFTQLRQAFVDSNQVPTDEVLHSAAQRYLEDVAAARGTLVEAYDRAVTAYTQARRIEEARTLRTKQQRYELPEGAVAFNNHYYLLIREHFPWRQAQAHCESLGGYLACIGSEEEMAFVKSLANEDDGFWLGGTDEHQEGQWRWVDGSPFDYTDWAPGRPDNQRRRQHYLWARKNSQWDDLWPNTSYVKCFICEWDAPGEE